MIHTTYVEFLLSEYKGTGLYHSCLNQETSDINQVRLKHAIGFLFILFKKSKSKKHLTNLRHFILTAISALGVCAVTLALSQLQGNKTHYKLIIYNILIT